MDQPTSFTTENRELIAEQARKVRALYPELFAALDERDRRIQRALYRIPHPTDQETLAPPQSVEQALNTLRKLNSGISRISEERV